MTKALRSSNVELLRIVAMISIVLYHCLSEYVPHEQDDRLVLSIYYLSHWGVPVFLLISGFFTVKFSFEKIIQFWLYCAVWMVLSYLFSCVLGYHKFDIVSLGTCFLPFSHTSLWFVPFYFWLLILAPFLNVGLAHLDDKKLRISLFVLMCATLYFSLVWKSDIIHAGHSIIYFICMYVLGYYLRRVLSRKHFTFKSLLTGGGIYFVLVILVTFILPVSYQKLWKGVVFFYVSPGLIVSAVILFLLFSKIRIQSRIINYVAESAFAIYLFHENQWSHDFFYGIVHNFISTYSGLERLGGLFCFVLVVSGCVVIVDKIVRKPITHLVGVMQDKIKLFQSVTK